ncbi:MAG: hypothetical protein LBF78_12755 [Treponema sp.]|jgi:hypothetical protein|nr:hypothetical protein [Treponema sp.]
MKAISQMFIGTTGEWESENPRLYKAVWGIEELPDGRRLLKIGNGRDCWNALGYVDADYIKGLPALLEETIADAEAIARAAVEAAVEAEADRAQGAEDLIQGAVEAEAERAQEAEGLLRSAVEAKSAVTRIMVQPHNSQATVNGVKTILGVWILHEGTTDSHIFSVIDEDPSEFENPEDAFFAYAQIPGEGMSSEAYRLYNSAGILSWDIRSTVVKHAGLGFYYNTTMEAIDQYDGISNNDDGGEIVWT